MWQSFECCGKKIIGKPCEGEPHARFEVAGDGNGSYRAIAWPYLSVPVSGKRIVNMARVSTVKWNLKEAWGKPLVRRTEIMYKAYSLDKTAEQVEVR